MPRLPRKNVAIPAVQGAKRRPGRPPKAKVAIEPSKIMRAAAVVNPPEAVVKRDRVKQVWNLADGVKVTMEFWSDAMPDYNARQNFVTIATGTAKGGILPDALGPQQYAPVGAPRGMAEESRTNLTNMAGYGMTRGTMDPVEALNGVPGLTATQKAVQRTLESAEETAIESELGSIPEDDELQPEDLQVAH